MVERKEILSNLRHKKSEKKNTMVQLIGNFDFAALCLPTVPWGKSTRKMQFFRKVYHNHLQIDRYRCCFLNRSSLCVCFCGRGRFIFSLLLQLFSRHNWIFPPWRSSEDDEVSVSILGKSDETARAFDEMNVLLYFVHVFESMCAFGGGKRRPRKREAPFFPSISNDSFEEEVYLPP